MKKKFDENDLIKRIPVPLVAKILGTGEDFVRVGLQEQRLPIGTAVKLSSEWTYYIPKYLLTLFVGEEVVEERLKTLLDNKNNKKEG